MVRPVKERDEEIVQLYRQGMSIRTLADSYNLTPHKVQRILQRREEDQRWERMTPNERVEELLRSLGV